MDLKRIDFQSNKLETEKHTYRIVDSLSVDKYQEFLILQQQVSYGISFEESFNIDKQIYEALKKTDFVQASALLYNKMAGISRNIEKRNDPVLRICALFFIREDEDQSKYNKELCDEKIEDWTTAGVDFKDFFQLAAMLVPGLLNAFDEILALTSIVENKAAEVGEAMNVLKSTTKQPLESQESGND